jgi:integrase
VQVYLLPQHFPPLSRKPSIRVFRAVTERVAVRSDAARQFFVTRDMIDKVIEKCPDAEWRLIVSLSRFGGLRCPSEHLALKWADVNWDGRILVRSPKTEHHEGKGTRIIPLFPELRPYLSKVFEDAEPGTEFVINRYRDSNANLRTQFERIIHRAGLEPWEKLFQNLRATRQTELAETWPIHVVCRWLGNSRAVAQEHYLQVTDDHFARALQEPAAPPVNAANAAPGSAAQNQAQCPPVSSQSEPQTPKTAESQAKALSGVADSERPTAVASVTPAGLEPATCGLEGRCSSN